MKKIDKDFMNMQIKCPSIRMTALLNTPRENDLFVHILINKEYVH